MENAVMVVRPEDPAVSDLPRAQTAELRISAAIVRNKNFLNTEKFFIFSS
jgi:hypothetical protein